MAAGQMHPLARVDEPFHRWSAADLNSLDLEDWFRYEIVDGSLLVSPAPTLDHELASEQLRASLRAVLRPGTKVIGPAQIDLGRTCPVPDLVVATVAALRGRQMLRPDDVLLAVEVMSPSSVSADRILKPALYAQAGIAHYWRVELDPLRLIIHRLDGDTYRTVGAWSAGQLATIDDPFAMSIDVTQLLPDA